MRTLAGWCVRHRRIVVLLWIAVLVVSIFSVSAAGTDYSNNFSFPHTQSFDAINLLKSVAPSHSGDQEQVVFGTSGGAKLTDPAVGQRINTMVDKINALPHVTPVTSPYDQNGNLIDPTGPNISKDQTVGFFQVNFDKQTQNISNTEAKNFVNAITKTSGDGLTVAVTGPLAEQANNQSFSSTGLGVLLALIVLLLVFGSIFAAILPILSALLALGTAVGVIGLLSHVLGMPSISPELTLLIGLGVGVDYALFIVTRHRQGLVAGRDVESSIINAVNTSGRAVLFAGIIVCIALLGMFALGVSFLYGLAVAAAIGVALTMVAALTLLPAMLGFIGPKVMSRKQKRNLAENGPRIVGADSKGFWPNWADRVQRYPVAVGRRGPGHHRGHRPPLLLAAAGVGRPGHRPGGDADAGRLRHALQGLRARLHRAARAGDRGAPESRPRAGKGRGRRRQAAGRRPEHSPHHAVHPEQDRRRLRGVDHRLSDHRPPGRRHHRSGESSAGHHRAAGGRHSGLNVLVAGTTAIYIDFANVLSSKLPLFIGLVVILSFLLLMTVFRSLLIPLTAAVMNLLSIGAALGILVAVFQWGDAGSLIGLQGTSPVEAFLPVMLFAILFGLSMDYQVFLVSRMHEEYIKSGGNNRVAVRNGLAATGKTITAAALIMILVFGSFILGGNRVIKEFGIGLAGGIFVDAVLIRMAIVPSIMMMFGKANWWFPAWLDRILPKLSVDADDLDTSNMPEDPGSEPQPELAGSLK